MPMSRVSQHIKTTLIFMGIFASFAIPSITHAQVDPRCFTKDECVTERKIILSPLEDTLGVASTEEAERGFYTGSDAVATCGVLTVQGQEPEPLGFCLPAGQAITKIGFGGKTEFAHIGEFIQFIYNYGIILASIISVIMIIVAGLQWTMSGGNTSTIDSAKKRIGGAIVGLVIALLSYTILFAINPQLLNLRLPQTWMIKQAKIQGQYCFELPSSTPKIARFVADNVFTSKEQKAAAAAQLNNWDIDPQKAPCGYEYLTSRGRENSCLGTYCGVGKVCVKEIPTEPSKCVTGVLSGTIQMKGIFTPDRAVENDVLLMALCEDGSVKQALDTDSTQGVDGKETYTFTGKPNPNICSNSGGLVGFYIAAEVNDPGGGDDDFHAIGRLQQGSAQCSINLSQLAYATEGISIDCSDDSADARCGCEGFAEFHEDALGTLKNMFPTLKKDHLFSLEELTAGARCDLILTREQFPAMGDSTDAADCSENNLTSG